jgi:phosphoribosylanthranilate isomerase
MNRNRVLCKICGIKDFPTAELIARLGANFIGLHAIWRIKNEDITNFIRITHELCKDYDIKPVLVTRQQDVNAVVAMVEQVEPAYVQLHAPWSKEEIMRLREELYEKGFQWIQLIGVIGLENYERFSRSSEILGMVDLLLLDSSFRGGTGRQTDPVLLKEAIATIGSTPFFLAGGLTPENVGDYIKELHPFGVDVQTGVEYPDKPGTKDPIRIVAFLQAVRSAETVA